MWRDKALSIISEFVFPVALLCMLTGLFWVDDRSIFHKVFYYLCVLPALLFFALRPHTVVTDLLDSKVFAAYLLFSVYTVITLIWSSTPESAMRLAKRPFLILFLFCLVFELACSNKERLKKAVIAASVISIVAAAFALLHYWQGTEAGSDRLVGYGAFDNPLLTSHVFGFFMAWWLGMLIGEKNKFQPYAITAIFVLGSLLLASGSRTPLLATAAVVIWLAVISGNRRGALAVLVVALITMTVWLFTPGILTQRGLSHRTEIWADVWQQVMQKPWFGYGYEAPLRVYLEGIHITLLDAHNMSLSILFHGGFLGLILWIAIYGRALLESWQWRKNRWVQAFSATVVYGLVAGMTEGGSFFSRPKEHWFMIWIPLVLLAATTWRLRKHDDF